jgi:hypothetical protein
MAAKARVTVRLAPSYLHALAYIAAREGFAPAEIAREMLAALVERTLRERGWRRDWEQSYAAWKAEQGARPGRVESPDQLDYDRLAAGVAFTPAAPLESAEVGS